MTDETVSGESVQQMTLGDSAPEAMGAREAAQLLSSLRRKKPDETPAQTPQVREPVEAAPDNSALEADATPPQEVTGEIEEADPAPQEPPIDLPRSWSKERTDAWAKLDRDTQQYLLDHDREASTAVRKAQNEAAEQRKAIDADRQRVEQARAQYEKALPALLQTLQDQQAGEFSDVRTIADVEKLAREDWPRYALWDAQQKKMAVIAQEVNSAQQRQAQEKQAKLSEFIAKEAAQFLERVPEFANPETRAKLQGEAIAMLQEIGFSQDELGSMARGDKDLSIHDHRLQLLIRDGLKFRQGQQKARAAVQRPVPQVQRPGVSQPKGAARDVAVQQLSKRLDQTGSVKDAARLLREKRAARVN